MSSFVWIRLYTVRICTWRGNTRLLRRDENVLFIFTITEPLSLVVKRWFCWSDKVETKIIKEIKFFLNDFYQKRKGEETTKNSVKLSIQQVRDCQAYVKCVCFYLENVVSFVSFYFPKWWTLVRVLILFFFCVFIITFFLCFVTCVYPPD